MKEVFLYGWFNCKCYFGNYTIFLVIVIIINVKKNKIKYQEYQKQLLQLDNIGFSKSQFIAFYSSQGLLNFYIDTNLRKIACELQSLSVILIDFDDIIKYEIVFDNMLVKDNAVGNAIVGGIVAGGVGAIVGASSANSKQFINSIVIHIYRKSYIPLTYNLSSKPLSKISNEYAQMIQRLDFLSYNLDSILNNKFIQIQTT